MMPEFKPTVPIGVVIPAFKVSKEITKVLKTIPTWVTHIVVVDDKCPERSGDIVQKNFTSKKIHVIYHEENKGVGGSVVSGYRFLLEKMNSGVIVKIDGDGQMDTTHMPELLAPILDGDADYCKGTRFENLEDLERMPWIRMYGNAILSIMSKFSTGYWNVNDPTNGYTAISVGVLERINLERLSQGYFFESDMLFRLSLAKAVVADVPMPSIYGTEKSNLKIRRIIFDFVARHSINFTKRILYKYYLREWNVATFELPIGLALTLFSILFGIGTWIESSQSGQFSSAGSVMLSATSLLIGIQLLLAFLSYDIASVPRSPLRKLRKSKPRGTIQSQPNQSRKSGKRRG